MLPRVNVPRALMMSDEKENGEQGKQGHAKARESRKGKSVEARKETTHLMPKYEEVGVLKQLLPAIHDVEGSERRRRVRESTEYLRPLALQ
jgi:hypothetical protein